MVINIQDDILRLRAMGLLERLLQDQATGHNILWATDAYAHLGVGYQRGEEISTVRITGENSDLIKTRARKAMEQQSERTKQHAEVFTPLWIVEKMNDFADEQWFRRKTGIHKLTDEGKIYFAKDKNWKRYAKARRLEITCGEAPFLATRYDVETGEALPVEDRIGLLDRKLRTVSENAADESEWKEWALIAAQSIYGYELQGDNLLIARVNILCTLEEHFMHRWKQKADKLWMEKLCRVISWNLWQMDGIKGCIPLPPVPTEEQLTLFPSPYEQENLFGEIDHPPTPCRIYNWLGHQIIPYPTLREKGSEVMKFDFIVGNPPYQEEISDAEKNSSLAKQLFPSFIQESVNCASKGVALITPSRWFAGDAQDKSFLKLREFLRQNNHISRLVYYPNEKEVFSNVIIKGGVCYFVYDWDYSGDVVFTTVENGIEHTMNRPLFEEGLDVVITDPIKISVLMKVKAQTENYLTEITKGRNAFGIIGKESVVESVAQIDPFPDCCELRLKGNEIRYIKREAVQKSVDVFNSYKVFISKSAGAPNTDKKVIGRAYIGGPLSACTDSLIPIGCFSNKAEAENLQKYLTTKFLRYLVSILKMSQNVTQIVYKYVPLQDFTFNSDVDWSKPIPEIDQQLYAKYGLDETEIAFIESHVKEMV